MNQKLVSLITDQIGVNEERVVEDARLIEDLGIDSLDVVELLMAVEEEYEINITDEDANKWQTVGDIEKYLKEKGLIK